MGTRSGLTRGCRSKTLGAKRYIRLLFEPPSELWVGDYHEAPIQYEYEYGDLRGIDGLHLASSAPGAPASRPPWSATSPGMPAACRPYHSRR